PHTIPFARMSEGPERPMSSATEDLALVQRILRGSPSELPRLAARLRFILRALRYLDRKRGGLVGSQELLDLAQDVLVLVWRKLPEYEGLSALEGWVYGICVLEYQNALRKKERLVREPQEIVNRSGAPDETVC